MKWITFTRLFSFIDDRGYTTPNSIIAFRRTVLTFRHKKMPNAFTYTVEAAGYRYDLKINLWLVEFYFTWKSDV